MSDPLDSMNILTQRDPSGALQIVADQYEQATFDVPVINGENDGRKITSVIVTGMGGSALAALVVKVWVNDSLKVPFEVVRDYSLPAHVNKNTLVIVSSYSGNTEETVSAFEQAREKGAQIAIVTSGGKLKEIAEQEQIAWVELTPGVQPRMAMIQGLRAMVSLLVHFEILKQEQLDEIADAADWLKTEISRWVPSVPVSENLPKRLAHQAAGKTAVFYGGSLTAPLAYKWKISWNETAKNTAFWNQYSEYDHNEFMGWTSHPIEKPFAVFDLISQLEHPQILKRFEISDRLLSGLRPKATTIEIEGDTVIKQMLWGAILADFTSVYLAVLNGVDPVPVDLIEKLKKEL